MNERGGHRSFIPFFLMDTPEGLFYRLGFLGSCERVLGFALLGWLLSIKKKGIKDLLRGKGGEERGYFIF